MMHLFGVVLVAVLSSPFGSFVVGVFVGLFFGGMIGAHKILEAQRRRDASFFDTWR